MYKSAIHSNQFIVLELDRKSGNYSVEVTDGLPYKILHNRCKCALCLTVIESKHGHDFVRCACGRIFTDGGHDYIHRGFTDLSDIIDLSEIVNLGLDNGWV